MTELSANFAASEFACHCGKCSFSISNIVPVNVDLALVALLESLRSDLLGTPITVSSGRRCGIHNREVGGAENSQHLYGRAADITVEGHSPKMVYSVLDQGPMADRIGLGLYLTFVHVDVRGYKARWK